MTANLLTDDSVYAIIQIKWQKMPGEIVARWRKNVPPEVSKEEVEKVVEAYFPQTRKYRGKSGSHWLIVEDADLKFAEENGFPTGTTRG